MPTLGTLGRYMYLQLLEKNVDVNQSLSESGLEE